MSPIIHSKILTREALTNGFTNTARATLDDLRIEDLIEATIPSRGAIVAKWRKDADPFPDVLVVRDADLSDTHAWLSSFFPTLSPITQWCRIIPQSHIGRLLDRNYRPSLDGKLGGWIGTVLAECSAQADHNVNLKELPGTAALTSATFAAARSIAVWGEQTELREIATRHDELSIKLRDGIRPISATQPLPVWQALNGHEDVTDKNPDRRALAPFMLLFDRIQSSHSVATENVSQIVSVAIRDFGIELLADCARGPQSDRVRALDGVAQILARETKAASSDALLGFAASLVDPGIAVLPNLLRKYAGRFPMAPLWLGAFAGCWSPASVLSDYSGLGRLIAKALLAESDLEEKPQCDISYDEISRWLNGVTASKLPLRGMAARSLSIEISLGVTCPFAIGRADVVRSEGSGSYRREEISNSAAENPKSRMAAASSPLAFLSRSMDELTKRVHSLEKYISDDIEQKRKGALESRQQDLLPGLSSEPTTSSKKRR